MSNSTSAKPADHGGTSPENSGELPSSEASQSNRTDTAETQASDNGCAPDQVTSGSNAGHGTGDSRKQTTEPQESGAAHAGASGGKDAADSDARGGADEGPADAANEGDAQSGATNEAQRDEEADSVEPASDAGRSERAQSQPDSDQVAAARTDENDPPAEPPEDPENAEEETLDLRALFASSDPDFASPSDTFELARGAKSTGSRATATGGEDADPPLDLPLDASTSEADASPFGRVSSEIGASTGLQRAANASDSFTPNADEDPLADAVQSALRSVYGEENSADEYRWGEEVGDQEGGGPVLQWAGAGATGAGEADASRTEHDRNTNVFAAPQRENAIDEETTEAVLSYLYEHMGEDNTVNPAMASQPPAQTDRAGDDEWQTDEQWRENTVAARGPESATPDDYVYSDRQSAAAADVSARHEPTQTRSDSSGASADFATPMDLSLDSSEASGKLLGAAGLGLIGGIAVAGVAAVFVFNSFTTQQPADAPIERTQARLSDTEQVSTPADGALTATESVRKDSARLGEPQEASAAPNQTAAAVTPQADTAELVGAASDQPASRTDRAATQPQIRAIDVTGRANQPIPLDLTVAEFDGDGFVRMDGLPDGVKLSAGVDTGNGSWLLSAGRAEGLALTVPDSYAGDFTLEARLLADDARTTISETASFQVSVTAPPARQAAAVQTSALSPDTAATQGDGAGTLSRATRLLRQGDVRGAREILRTEAEAGNAQAALALGKSYDPMTFTPDSPANAAPDATEAFRWYQKAVELGASEGDRRITELKSWLLQ